MVKQLAVSTLVFGLVSISFGWLMTDNFETNLHPWTINEELVSPCYGSHLGSVARAMGGYEGNYGLAVWSNAANSNKSNHVIAGRFVSAGSEAGVTGQWTYSLFGMLPSAYSASSQVGPEFSVQNTRRVGDGTTTSTAIAGIQYVASSYVSNKWNIWVQATAGFATWVGIPASRWNIQPVLSPGTPQFYYYIFFGQHYCHYWCYVCFGWLQGAGIAISLKWTTTQIHTLPS
jgi:hypothetical protein